MLYFSEYWAQDKPTMGFSWHGMAHKIFREWDQLPGSSVRCCPSEGFWLQFLLISAAPWHLSLTPPGERTSASPTAGCGHLQVCGVAGGVGMGMSSWLTQLIIMPAGQMQSCSTIPLLLYFALSNGWSFSSCSGKFAFELLYLQPVNSNGRS